MHKQVLSSVRSREVISGSTELQFDIVGIESALHADLFDDLPFWIPLAGIDCPEQHSTRCDLCHKYAWLH